MRPAEGTAGLERWVRQGAGELLEQDLSRFARSEDPVLHLGLAKHERLGEKGKTTQSGRVHEAHDMALGGKDEVEAERPRNAREQQDGRGFEARVESKVPSELGRLTRVLRT